MLSHCTKADLTITLDFTCKKSAIISMGNVFAPGQEQIIFIRIRCAIIKRKNVEEKGRNFKKLG